LYRPELSILLFDEEERRGIQGARFPYVSLLEVFVQEFAQLLVLVWG